jgi:hypothetical protein
VLKAYKEQHGTEQNYGFLKDPLLVNSLFLKKPERIEALGMVLLLALLIWRLMERAMRTHVDSAGTPLIGWDKKATERPTACMMVTKFSGLIVLKRGLHRQLARPLSVVQQQYLTALDVPAACFTDLQSGSRDRDDRGTPLTRNWYVSSRESRAISARASAPGKRGAGLSLAAWPVGKPHP